MPDSELIPVVHVASGEKFINDKGEKRDWFSIIKE